MCGALNAQPWYADGVQTDSRDVLPGDVFIALAGEQMDGHQFLKDAFARGAVAAMVSQTVDGFDVGDTRLVHVPDTLVALRLMAAEARRRAPAKVIGVTGSAGKTSVVHALRKALERLDRTHCSIKSFNNHVGVPLSLARMDREARFGVFELGMGGPGEIRANAELVRPDVAVITTIGAAHAAAFTSEEEIAKAKAEIFDGLGPDGIAVLGVDHPHADALIAAAEKAGVKVVTVSVTGQADVTPVRITEHHDCSCLTADVLGTPITYKIGQAGREWVLNSLLVLTAVKLVEGDLGHAALALAGLEAEPGRGRVHNLHLSHATATVLDDSYNANPTSMRAALRRLSMVPMARFSRRIAVLADMQELGAESDRLHAEVAQDIKRFGITKVLAFGEKIASASRHVGIDVEEWTSIPGAVEALCDRMRQGDAIMVKGANSAGLSRFVEELLARHMDDVARPVEKEGVARAL